MPHIPKRVLRWLGIVALFVGVSLFGVASAVLFTVMGDLPQISALDDQQPPTTTRVLGRDGSVVAEFATERRQPVTYEQIPVVLRQAIMSAEDKDFFQHSGLNLKAIVVTIGRRVLFLRKTGGASTITQQLSRGLFPTSVGFERTGLAGIVRKVKELVVAIQIEKRYTKPEILTMYCNKIYWGHGAYGVEAASQLYFAKPVKDVTLDEAAMLAGIIQGNQRQSPYVNMKAAIGRRNYTLDQMAANGYISGADATAAKKRPIVTHGQPSAPRSIAPYFAETVRIQLAEKYGDKAVLEGGMTVKTGIDPLLQQAANRSLDAQLRVLDKESGRFRRPAHNLLAENKTIEGYKNSRWQRDIAAGDIIPAVVTASSGQTIALTAGKWQGTIDAKGFEWVSKKRAEDVVKRGDLIDVQVQKLDPKAQTFSGRLEQTPELEGAIVAIDNHTGAILAMVGGKNFQVNQFNRVLQAKRQVGSLFKAFVYTAAIDGGYTAATKLEDVPTQFVVGPNQPLYEPRNFDHQFKGIVSVREALEDSRNVPTIRLMDSLTPQRVIGYARKFGITADLPPYLPIAIGAGDDTLMNMTSAYTTFPNQGVRMSPLMVLDVEDREGNVLEQHQPIPHEAIRPDTAFIMTYLFEGVTKNGTAQRAGAEIPDWPIGGKTGTTDDATDAWFVGFDPDITIGVWVGFDQKKSIGTTQQGASAALPIWISMMKPYIANRRAKSGEVPVFDHPGNIVFQMSDGILEAFIAGTEPGGGSHQPPAVDQTSSSTASSSLPSARRIR